MIKLKNLLLLVHPDKQEQQQEQKIGSIIIPVTVKNNPKTAWGTVVATGSGNSYYNMDIKPGYKVCYDNREKKIEIDGCLLLRLDHVLFYRNEE